METSASETKAYETYFRIRVSVRYHQRRARWFESWDLWVKGLSVMLGTAAVAALWKDHEDAAAWAAAIITAATTLSLVFGFSTKSRQHADLARKYLDLEAELVSTVEPDLQFLHNLDGRIRLIEGEEPPPLGALVTLCQNELVRQDGQEDYIVPLPLHHRLLAHLFDFPAPKPVIPPGA
jgi:hypothetical protein